MKETKLETPIPVIQDVAPPNLPPSVDIPETVDPFAYSDIKDVVRFPSGFQCSVKFESRRGYVTFLACENDIELHGRQIYARCAAGDFGKVPDYATSESDVAAFVRFQMDRALAAANKAVTVYQDRVDVGRDTDVDRAALLAWKGYRVDVNLIPQQTNFPYNIEWPISPAAEEGAKNQTQEDQKLVLAS